MCRSPAGPPFIPASPLPRTVTTWPSSIPAGMLISICRAARTLPLPPHFLQGSSTILPRPPQREQVCWLFITPKAVRCCTLTTPRPWQSGQVLGLVPFAAPVPPHAEQSSTRWVLTVFLQPLAASSKVRVTDARTSRPRAGALGLRPPKPKPPPPPPKMEEKISPKSMSPPSKPKPPPP